MSLPEAATPLEIRLLKRIAELETVNAQLNDEITKHKHTEEQLIVERSYLHTLFEHNGSGHLVVSSNRQIIQVNQQFCEMFGYTEEELIGQSAEILHLDTLHYEEWAPRFKEARDGLTRLSAEYPWRHKDGSTFWCMFTGVKLQLPDGDSRVIWSVIDITDLKNAEEERISLEKQLLHSQKLECLGVLAGGIAHDFNNILTSIVGNAELALMRLNPESPVMDNLHKIEKAAGRAADLAKQMLAYSGKGKFLVENLDLNRLVEEMLHMLEVSISKKAVLRLNQFQSLPAVAADATQMRQIIMNLVINASEAIGETSGVIAITTGCVDCDCSYLKDVFLEENLTNGLYVYLEIADTGCGMNRDTLAKIFDPFFTTKFTGRGLGMAAVLGIVRGHKGAIKVYSEQGKGSTFKIMLPASEMPAELFNGACDRDDWKGSGTVLLVDDEETIRGIGVEMLKELGFNAITANDGREALEAFKNNPDISFVILDLTMPHMDGEQCYRELRKIKPDLKIIISSGYNEQEVTQKFIGKGLAGFIQKPYKFSVLKEAVRVL